MANSLANGVRRSEAEETMDKLDRERRRGRPPGSEPYHGSSGPASEPPRKGWSGADYTQPTTANSRQPTQAPGRPGTGNNRSSASPQARGPARPGGTRYHLDPGQQASQSLLNPSHQACLDLEHQGLLTPSDRDFLDPGHRECSEAAPSSYRRIKATMAWPCTAQQERYR